MAKNKVIKEQKLSYQELSELYDEMSNELDYYVHYERDTSRQLTYLKDFISFKQLDEEFAYFTEHAIEDPDEELPFPHLILK